MKILSRIRNAIRPTDEAEQAKKIYSFTVSDEEHGWLGEAKLMVSRDGIYKDFEWYTHPELYQLYKRIKRMTFEDAYLYARERSHEYYTRAFEQSEIIG